jgi:transcriptional regulator with XRE-family HTH domain
MQSEMKQALGLAIKEFRMHRGLPQESLGASQTYISNLERGKWNATLDKIEQISHTLDVHPVSVIVAGYLKTDPTQNLNTLLERISKEVTNIATGN